MRFDGSSGAGGTAQSSMSRAADGGTLATTYFIALSIGLAYMRIKSLFQEKSDEAEVGGEDDSESNDGYEVKFESESTPQLTGKTTRRIEGKDQNLLNPGPDSDAVSVKEAINSIVQEDPKVTIRVGDESIEDRASRITKRLESLNPESQRSFAIAMEGGKPDHDVSITIEDREKGNIEFLANSEKNSGWIMQSNARIPQSEIIEEVGRQNSQSHRSIKAIMTEANQEDETYAVHGDTQYSVLVTPDAVFIFDKNGLVRDSVEIDEISNTVTSSAEEINGRTALEQRREAVADYGGSRNAQVVTASGQIGRSTGRKQRELTP